MAEKTDRKPHIWGSTRWFFKALDICRIPPVLELLSHLFSRVSRLTAAEITAAMLIFGPGWLDYDNIRIAEGRMLKLVFLINRNRPFATLHTINYPRARDNSSRHLSDIIHELVHVRQYEAVGSFYMWEALRAQWQWGNMAYDYGSWQGLVNGKNRGWHLSDYCREQQAAIAEDYYGLVLCSEIDISPEIKEAYEFFMQELKLGQL